MTTREIAGNRVLTALLLAKTETQDELQQTLRSLVGDIRNHPGCTTCILGQDVAGGPHFLLYIVWADAVAMEVAVSAEPFRVLLGAASTLSERARFRMSVAEQGPSPELADLPRCARAS